MKVPPAAPEPVGEEKAEPKEPAAEASGTEPKPVTGPPEVKRHAVPPDLVSQDAGKAGEAEPPDPDDQPAGPGDDNTPFDDDKTAEVIAEIVAKEGDDLLAAQDAAAGKAEAKVRAKAKGPGLFGRKWVRRVILLVVAGGIVAAAVLPKTRYLALNTAGVRSSSSVVVIDSTTELPLKGVSISLAGRDAETGSDGRAAFSGLQLGPAELTIEQTGFETIKRTIVIGWGSNPLGSFALKATGVQYVIEVRDYLSQKPVEGVEATDGTATALSDAKGKITLTLDSPVVEKGGITLSKGGYRSDKVTLNENPKKATKVSLVPDRPTVFVAKQSDKYTLYKSDIDGKNREVLLPGTGRETTNISLALSPDGKRVAYVSTRDGKRDSGGALKSSLTLITTSNGAPVTIAEASQIQLVDWIGTRIIFELSSPDGTSGSRYTVYSYDYASNSRIQLAAANQLSAVLSAQGSIYYAVAADPGNPSLQLGLFKVRPDGKGEARILEAEPVTVLRSTYNTLSLQIEDGTWYAYDMISGSKTQMGSPSSLANRLYIDNASRTRSLWVSQGVLKSYESASGKDTDIATLDGLTYPVQWLSDSAAVFRLSSGSETADYAVSLAGGQPRKISEVFPAYGFAQAQ